MFKYAQKFNQEIGDWNVDIVTNMSYMFHYADIFNKDIGNWNVDNSNFEYMFRVTDADIFNKDIDNSFGR